MSRSTMPGLGALSLIINDAYSALRSSRWIGVLLLWGALECLAPHPADAAPEGTMTWGPHVTLAARWLDPAETEALNTPFMDLYAIHDAVEKPMPARPITPRLADSW